MLVFFGDIYLNDFIGVEEDEGFVGIVVNCFKLKLERWVLKLVLNWMLFGLIFLWMIGGLYCVWRKDSLCVILRVIRCFIG